MAAVADGRIEARGTRAAAEVTAAETVDVADTVDDDWSASASATDNDDEACNAAIDDAAASRDGRRGCAGATPDLGAYVMDGPAPFDSDN